MVREGGHDEQKASLLRRVAAPKPPISCPDPSPSRPAWMPMYTPCIVPPPGLARPEPVRCTDPGSGEDEEGHSLWGGEVERGQGPRGTQLVPYGILDGPKYANRTPRPFSPHTHLTKCDQPACGGQLLVGDGEPQVGHAQPQEAAQAIHKREVQACSKGRGGGTICRPASKKCARGKGEGGCAHCQCTLNW